MESIIRKVKDFEVTGDGKATAWRKARWEALSPLNAVGAAYATRFKMLYSPTGMYILFDCQDQRLTCTAMADFDNLWTQDVVEVFLWPDTRQPLYFEYEISPLGAELPILVPNHKGAFMGWRPWHYEGDRKIRRATSVRGGKKAPKATVTGWSAEMFFPFALLKGLGHVPPEPGSQWRANFYRIDYDREKSVSWSWSPLKTINFHLFREFGTIVFG